MVSKRIIPLILAGFLVLSGAAFAQNPIVTTGGSSTASGSSSTSDSSISDKVCDPSVFVRMKQKAMLEAQRENYINQSIITKPDSLFAITCYDKQLGQAMKNGGVKTKNADGSESTKDYEDNVKTNSPVINDFAKPFKDDKPVLTSALGSKETKTTSAWDAEAKTASGSFDCGEMQKLWQQSQCQNFTNSLLPTLAETGAKSPDSRNQPVACTNGKDDPDTTYGDTFTFKKGISDINAPGANQENFEKVDLKLCDQLPYPDLAKHDCPVQAGQVDACSPGKDQGLASDGLRSISCVNNGCSAQVINGKRICAKTKVGTGSD